jgi:hypothetical protein
MTDVKNALTDVQESIKNRCSRYRLSMNLMDPHLTCRFRLLFQDMTGRASAPDAFARTSYNPINAAECHLPEKTGRQGKKQSPCNGYTGAIALAQTRRFACGGKYPCKCPHTDPCCLQPLHIRDCSCQCRVSKSHRNYSGRPGCGKRGPCCITGFFFRSPRTARHGLRYRSLLEKLMALMGKK